MDELGVGIGLAKSLVSHKGTLEFAKRFLYQGHDCSPVPFKEFFAARGSIAALIEFGTKYCLRLSQLLDIRGKGYRVKGLLMKSLTKLPIKVRNLVVMVMAPSGPGGSICEWVTLESAYSRSTRSNFALAL